jgi:hypothetical protein
MTVKVFGNDSNSSRLYSRRNKEWIKFGECLLSHSSQYFVFLSDIQKRKESVQFGECLLPCSSEYFVFLSRIQKHKEQIKIGECLLPLPVEYFVFLSDIRKHEDENIQSCILHRFVTWREKYGFRVFKNRVLRIILGLTARINRTGENCRMSTSYFGLFTKH